jgi:hypothetical protein
MVVVDNDDEAQLSVTRDRIDHAEGCGHSTE